jgi:hypothetical protein
MRVCISATCAGTAGPHGSMCRFKSQVRLHDQRSSTRPKHPTIGHLLKSYCRLVEDGASRTAERSRQKAGQASGGECVGQPSPGAHRRFQAGQTRTRLRRTLTHSMMVPKAIANKALISFFTGISWGRPSILTLACQKDEGHVTW